MCRTWIVIDAHSDQKKPTCMPAVLSMSCERFAWWGHTASYKTKHATQWDWAVLPAWLHASLRMRCCDCASTLLWWVPCQKVQLCPAELVPETLSPQAVSTKHLERFRITWKCESAQHMYAVTVSWCRLWASSSFTIMTYMYNINTGNDGKQFSNKAQNPTMPMALLLRWQSPWKQTSLSSITLLCFCVAM